MTELKKALMERDDLTSEQADKAIQEARASFYEALDNGDMPFDFMQDEFGLEPDYLTDLI
jgi:hypothetical protein